MKLRRQGLLLVVIGLADFLLILLIIWLLFSEANTEPSKKVSTGQDYMESKVVALTFDDGPNAEYTELLLDGLRERDVKASFFLLGKCLHGNEEIVKQMDMDGHLIGVHGMQHIDLTQKSKTEALKQLEDTQTAIKAITGKESEYVRPPYGNWNQTLEDAVSDELGMASVFWSVDSIDWKLQNTSQIVRTVTKGIEDGDIILMHDEFLTSVEAALQIVDNLLADGYTFVTVDELMIE